jgi:hypothetical protein
MTSDWDDGEQPQPRPLDWRGLPARERRVWFERLWLDVCMLRERYLLSVRSGWWEDSLQVEALAAVAAWIARYDAGDWDDPPGKLSLLLELERLEPLLRNGNQPFVPERDLADFTAHLSELGCEPPAGGGALGHSGARE